MEQKKQCNKCKKIKKISEFGPQKGLKDGISSTCRECKAKYQQKYNKAKNPKSEEITPKITKVPLKKFQIECVKAFGNTIVSKKYNKASIIEAYKKHGLDVDVKEFETKGHDGKNTHFKIVRK